MNDHIMGETMRCTTLRGKAVWEGIPPGRLTLNSPDMIQQLVLDGSGIGAFRIASSRRTCAANG
jgi:DNA-binding transcriptional LysR family regulator